MKVAIFGFGNVGKQIAKIMNDAKQEVVVAVRAGEFAGCEYPVLSFTEAAQQADAIVLAIHYTAVESVVAPLREAIAGKIVVDATNPLNDDWSPLLLGQENSAGETIQAMLPTAKVVKAFNTIFADVMSVETRANTVQSLTAFVASDHADATQWVSSVLAQSAFEAVNTGGLQNARYLEAMAHLNIQIAVEQGGGTSVGFVYQQCA